MLKEITANEILGAYQLGIIDANEARERLGFTPREQKEESNG